MPYRVNRTFAELKPARVLSEGIKVYDNESFASVRRVREGYTTLAENLYEPALFLGATLAMFDRGERVVQTKGDVLMFHGHSTERVWKQPLGRMQNVSEIIRQVEDSGFNIDALFVCNPGGFRLPCSRCFYFLSDIGAIFNSNDRRLVWAAWGQGLIRKY